MKRLLIGLAALALLTTGCGAYGPSCEKQGGREVQTGSSVYLMPVGKTLVPITEPIYTCELPR